MAGDSAGGDDRRSTPGWQLPAVVGLLVVALVAAAVIGGSPPFDPPPVRPAVGPVARPRRLHRGHLTQHLRRPSGPAYPDRSRQPEDAERASVHRAGQAGASVPAGLRRPSAGCRLAAGWTASRVRRPAGWPPGSMDGPVQDVAGWNVSHVVVDRLCATGMRGRIRPGLFAGWQQDRCGTAGGPSRWDASGWSSSLLISTRVRARRSQGPATRTTPTTWPPAVVARWHADCVPRRRGPADQATPADFPATDIAWPELDLHRRDRWFRPAATDSRRGACRRPGLVPGRIAHCLRSHVAPPLALGQNQAAWIEPAIRPDGTNLHVVRSRN